jgi:hypothetical protein
LCRCFWPWRADVGPCAGWLGGRASGGWSGSPCRDWRAGGVCAGRAVVYGGLVAVVSAVRVLRRRRRVFGGRPLAARRWLFSRGPSTTESGYAVLNWSPQPLLAAARCISLSRPATVRVSSVTCNNTQTCNSTWIVQRMPMSERSDMDQASRQLHHRASFHGFSCIQPNTGAGTCPAAPARSPGAGTVASRPGHVVNATAASAAEANNCRRADLAVIHPRCCHSRSASESPAITTSPNGMER